MKYYNMKRQIVCLLVACIVLSVSMVRADEPALRYVDAREFRIINHGWTGEDERGKVKGERTEEPHTLTAYTRIPTYLKDSIRQELWDRGLNSAGIGIRFATNSKRIGIRYNLHSNFHMAHMADTGIKGTDLYIWCPDDKLRVKNEELRMKDPSRRKPLLPFQREDAPGHWAYVNTNRPTKDSIQSKIYVEHMDGEMHECLIYLPLYDGVNWMEIGVDSDAVLIQPQLDNPRKKMRVVNYGTSIMHGGCASRTGMAATNIMQRELNVEMVNLGVSGEGKLVYPMARAMAEMEDVIAYIIDPVPNCTQMMCDTLTYDFIKILSNARPHVPIIMVEGPMYPYAKFDSYFRDYLPAKNAAFRKNYERLKKEGVKNLYYVTCDGLTGPDEEGTVDGIHLTDLGFRAYADKMEEVLRTIIKNL